MVIQEYVKRISNYTFSQNAQQLDVTCDPMSNLIFPLSIFSSRSLKHVTLSGTVCTTSSTLTWDLPTLTTLHLHHITVYDKCTDLFYKRPNLENIFLRRYTLIGTNVVTPQLNNLTIECCYVKLLLSTPGHTALVIKSCCRLQLSTEGLCSLEKVDLFIYEPRLEDAF